MSYRAYESEEQLCEDVASHARAAGFLVYPETGKFDLVLVRRGIQIGVQAKLRFTHHLVAQALEGVQWLERSRYIQRGPHYRLIACQPAKSIRGDAQVITRACHLLFLDMNNHPAHWLYRHSHGRHRRYALTRYGTPMDWRYYRWQPQKLVWLPPAIPNLPAGVPCPSTVGPWQIAAVRLEKICLRRGWVTCVDAQDVIASVDKHYSSNTLLRRFYECTTIRDTMNSKLRQWKPLPRVMPASRQFPRAWEMMTSS